MYNVCHGALYNQLSEQGLVAYTEMQMPLLGGLSVEKTGARKEAAQKEQLLSHLDSCQVRRRTSTYDVVRTPYDIVRQTYDVGFNIARTTSYVRYYIRYCTYDIVCFSKS